MILFGVPVDPDEQMTPRIESGQTYGGLRDESGSVIRFL